MSTEAIALIAALLVQTAALAFAGGKLWQVVRHHDNHLGNLSDWKHNHVTPRLYKLDELWRDAGKGD